MLFVYIISINICKKLKTYDTIPARMTNKMPKKITLKKFGTPDIGYLTPSTAPEIPFGVRRIFWIYATPGGVIRGRHTHKKTALMLFALAGTVTVKTETVDGTKKTFILDKPNVGLLIPPMVWHTEHCSHTSIQLALGSLPFDEKEFIRDYKTFKKS